MFPQQVAEDKIYAYFGGDRIALKPPLYLSIYYLLSKAEGQIHDVAWLEDTH